jgi:hypothetical protein
MDLAIDIIAGLMVFGLFIHDLNIGKIKNKRFMK